MFWKNLNVESKVNEDNISERDKALITKLDILTQAVERVYPDMKGLMWRSFVQGICMGLGTTVGLTLVLWLLTSLFAELKVIPGVGILIEQSKVEKIIPRPHLNSDRPKEK